MAFNPAKCQMVFYKHVSSTHKLWASDYTGFTTTQLPIKYLGVLLITGRTKQTQFDEVLNKISNLLNRWTQTFLSNGGRITLLKSIITAFPAYILQMTTIKKSTQIRLERLFNKFMWSGQRQQMHWASWRKAAKPQIVEGIGFKDLDQLLQVNFCKLWIKFRTQNSLWAKFMWGKYCKDQHPTLVLRKFGDSRIWVKMLKIRQIDETNYSWELGNGEINFWLDNWCPKDWLSAITNIYNSELKVADCWDGDNWSLGKLASILQPHSITKVVWKQFLNQFTIDQKELTWDRLVNYWWHWKIRKYAAIPFTIAWFIWMETNKVKFEEANPNVGITARNCVTYLQKMINWKGFPNISNSCTSIKSDLIQVIRVYWRTPNHPIVKFNTDGSFTKNGAGVGGIYINHLGKCLQYFYTPVLATDATETELIVVY
ncbi:uncharacterized protein LOC110036309 [Phalaenopsis equestris]|uniref:uncharacterized protein LOC110036309 n=1 Tax=Phalaenopsis equestris TaxID=78828 RepID=UPI0009E42E77|nr:uncharacterized protein LOC110036309 [Phalaenopsis equestris]